MHRNLVQKKQRSNMTCGTQTHNQVRSWMTSKNVIRQAVQFSIGYLKKNVKNHAGKIRPVKGKNGLNGNRLA
jgi:hypothetical protein